MAKNKMIKKQKSIIALALAVSMAIPSLAVYAEGNGTTTETTEEVATEIVAPVESELAEAHQVAKQVQRADTSVKTINEHNLIAENSNYRMFLKDDNLSIIIQDKKTGSIMESTVMEDDGASNDYWKNFMKSGIVLEVIEDVTTILKRVSLNEATIALDKRNDGFTADISYEKYGFSYTLNVTLTEEGFTAEILDESIQETNDFYRIGNIYVYPFMGYTHLGERDGYMLVPDGNGAIINLEDKDGRFTSGFSKRVYGDNIGYNESYVLSLLWGEYQTVNESELILAPVFGMIHSDTEMAYLGIIEEGEYDATIEAFPNGAYTNYNWISSKFRLRQVYVQPTSKSGGSTTLVEADRTHSDIKVRYVFTNGEKANYVGLAEKYRDYLFEKGKVETKNNDFNIRLDFLGADIEKWFIFDVAVPMTTIAQLKEILGELNNEGVEDIVAIYKGWQKGGVYTLPVNKFKVEGKLGSKGNLIDLIEESKEKGTEIYLEQDALRANPDTGNTTYNVAKRIDKRLFEELTYKTVFEKFVYLTATKSMNNLTRLFDALGKKDIVNVALTGVTNNLFSYTYSGDSYNRIFTAETYKETISKESEDTNLILDEPFSYLWKYSDALYNIPTGSSNYIFTDEDVPFLSIALKGVIPLYGDYTNFEADKQEYFLKLVETGIYPSFLLTYEDTSELLYTNSNDVFSAKYSVYKDDVIEYYKELKVVNELVKDSYIVGHEEPVNNLVVVTYDNDVKIYVNYNEKAVSVDGVTVEPLSYKVGDR